MVEDKRFERVNYREDSLPKGEYERCAFVNCFFSEADLSKITFKQCCFEGCDLSLVRTNDTVFSDVKFINSKLLGVRFDKCNDLLLSVHFDACQLNMAVFYKLKLPKTIFKNCDLQEADFTQADLSGSIFENCDLQRAVFNHTNLEKVDFRSAVHYSISPESNRIRKARFSIMGITGLLDKYDIEIA